MKIILLLLIANLCFFSCDSKSNISSFKIEKPTKIETKTQQTIFIKINTTVESADDRKYELELSISEYEKAKSELRIAELNVERCKIKAPFDGAVEEVVVNTFETIQPQVE